MYFKYVFFVCSKTIILQISKVSIKHSTHHPVDLSVFLSPADCRFPLFPLRRDSRDRFSSPLSRREEGGEYPGEQRFYGKDEDSESVISRERYPKKLTCV